MKNKITKLVLAMVCALALGASLTACTQSSPSSSSAGSTPASSAASTTSSSASSTATDPAKEFVGSWKLAAVEYMDLICVGDFQGLVGDAANFTLTVKEDGTGSIALGEDAQNFKWAVAGDEVNVTWEDSELANSASLDYDVLNDAIIFDMKDDTATTSANTNTTTDTSSQSAGTFIFTKDGKYLDYEAIDLTKTTPVTDQSKLPGKWQITAIGVMGLTMYGTPEQIQAAMGEDAFPVMVVNNDGTGSFDATSAATESAFKWATSGSGTTISYDSMGTAVDMPVTAIDDAIVVDMSPALGGMMEMYLVYTK